MFEGSTNVTDAHPFNENGDLVCTTCRRLAIAVWRIGGSRVCEHCVDRPDGSR